MRPREITGGVAAYYADCGRWYFSDGYYGNVSADDTNNHDLVFMMIG